MNYVSTLPPSSRAPRSTICVLDSGSISQEKRSQSATKCGSLDVVRYDAESLHSEFGARFRLVESSKESHETPFGSTQQFLYCYCRVEAE